jgi:hypothetical protein
MEPLKLRRVKYCDESGGLGWVGGCFGGVGGGVCGCVCWWGLGCVVMTRRRRWVWWTMRGRGWVELMG